jgi:D-xylose transport system ATP-binding protein
VRLRDDRRALDEARRRLQRVGATITDYRRPVQWLSGGQRQTIAIARVLHDDVRVAIFDEPTAALGVGPTARVLEVIQKVASEGVGVILVTHDIEAVLAVADRVVVLRLGEVSYRGPAAGLNEAELAQLMAGLPSERVLGAARAEPATVG